MKCGSLCTGYGGLDIAVKEVFGDAEIIWVADNDPSCQLVLKEHYPDATQLGDLTKIDYEKVEHVELLTAGFPCQDVSIAGYRRGLHEGTRTGLWYEIMRAVKSISPKYILLENVYGLFTSKSNRPMERCSRCLDEATTESTVLRAFGRVLGDLSEAGFDAEWSCIRGCDAGLPFNGERVFILAWATTTP